MDIFACWGAKTVRVSEHEPLRGPLVKGWGAGRLTITATCQTTPALGAWLLWYRRISKGVNERALSSICHFPPSPVARFRKSPPKQENGGAPV